MAAAGTGDIISLESGYGNENAAVTVNGLSFDGGLSSTGVNLLLGTGISSLTLLGAAPINVVDGPDANAIVGNDGDNTISVSSGVDVVTGGNGTDRLIIDYSAATASITGTLVDVTDGGTHAVTFTGVENFTITTGSGNDTITVGDGSNVLTTGLGDDTITAGNGPNIIDGGANNDTITAGSGVNTIQGGLGNDTIIAGDGGNSINGGDGDDGITTGSGNDVVVAGLGNDTVITGAGADVTTVNGGIDTVDSGSENDRLIVDFSSSTTAVSGGVTGGTLAGGYDGFFADVAGTSSVVFQATENFTVTTGSANDVIATGDGDDVLDGGAGSDQLNSGGGNDALLIGLGSDALDGGAGTDSVIFSGARADYQVNDLGGGVLQSIDLRNGSPDGTDTLVNIEGFVFTDLTFDATTVLTSNPPALFTVGNDTVTLPGAGNYSALAGDDTIFMTVTGETVHGNTGNDTYHVEATGNTVTELANEGTDTVQTASLASYALGANVENLTHTGSSDFVGVGNDLDNILTGGTGRDYLVGFEANDTLMGGSGVANELQGGIGNDTYVVEAVGDTITEFANEGTDTVLTSLSSFRMADNIEQLVHTGSIDFAGIGNDQDNLIVGGSGGDVLMGGGGRDYLVGLGGDDTLMGGSGVPNELQGGIGNDTYVVEAVGDTITEFANEGTDTVLTSLSSFRMADNVENLTFIGGSAHEGTGNALANTLTGSSGNDTLTGAGGNDVFNYRAGTNGLDTINDFNADNTNAAEHDHIDLQGRGLNYASLSMTAGSGGVTVDIPGGDAVFLKGVTAQSLDAGDFFF